MTPQERIDIEQSMPSMITLNLMQKTATIMQVPGINDYENLLGSRLVDYVAAMSVGGAVTNAEDIQRFRPEKEGWRPRLFDVAAIRYVVTDAKSRFAREGLAWPQASFGGTDVRVYSNDTALPRARWVPRVEVIPDSKALLNQLAYGTEDLAEVAFVEEPLPSGFTGDARPPAGSGSARFVRNDPEHLVIDIDAPGRGFLVLADQYSPGWRARVDDNAVPIVRANYAFRLVEVPAGSSRVEFVYRPASVAIGAAVSVVTLVILAIALFWKRGIEPRADRDLRRDDMV